VASFHRTTPPSPTRSPSSAGEVTRLRKPRALRPGGTIGIAAPAGPVDAHSLAAGEDLLRKAGFRVVHGDGILSQHGYLAGDDERRAAELMELVTDSTVDAIVCARGGYGCHRIVSMLDAAAVRKAAKPLVGYSDATTLLLWQIRQVGLIGFHGPMLDRGDELDSASLDALLDGLCGRGDPTLKGEPRRPGRGEGPLLGGSLSLVVASLGTPWEIETRGAILLLEDVGERPYRIDRMLHQLRAAGKLDDLAGIGVGNLCECDDPRYPETRAEDILLEIVASLGVPVVTGLPFGHGGPNTTWPMGADGRIDGERGEVEILERGVETQ